MLRKTSLSLTSFRPVVFVRNDTEVMIGIDWLPCFLNCGDSWLVTRKYASSHESPVTDGMFSYIVIHKLCIHTVFSSSAGSLPCWDEKWEILNFYVNSPSINPVLKVRTARLTSGLSKYSGRISFFLSIYIVENRSSFRNMVIKSFFRLLGIRKLLQRPTKKGLRKPISPFS